MKNGFWAHFWITGKPFIGYRTWCPSYNQRPSGPVMLLEAWWGSFNIKFIYIKRLGAFEHNSLRKMKVNDNGLVAKKYPCPQKKLTLHEWVCYNSAVSLLSLNLSPILLNQTFHSILFLHGFCICQVLRFPFEIYYLVERRREHLVQASFICQLYAFVWREQLLSKTF